MTIEFRSFTGAESVDATDDGVIFGLAIPYGRETIIGDLSHGGFRESVAPGACTKSIREADIVALFNHDSSRPLGRTSAGNLKLGNTSHGVEPELKPVDTTYGRDLAELVRSKVIKGWSFGFEAIRSDWTDDEGKPSDELRGTNRTIREMRLREVSPCTFPAYEMTSISARSTLLEQREALADGEGRPGGAKGSGKKPGEADSDADAQGDDDDSATVTQRKSKLAKGTLRRIPQISVSLHEALDLFADAGQESLPQKAQEAIALLSSAAEHADHIMDKEGLQAADANTRTAEKPKPANATSGNVSDDTALMDAVYAVISRDVASDGTLLEHNESGL